MTDAFDTLGLEPRMDLDADELEARYLSLSRDCHPDFHNGADTAELTAVMTRSADINDAYRQLRDPWQRGRVLAERADPGVMERTKKLCPAMLMEAMELAEAVIDTSPTEAPELVAQIREALAERLERISAAFAAGHAEDAATAIHEGRYFQKALDDLRRRIP